MSIVFVSFHDIAHISGHILFTCAIKIMLFLFFWTFFCIVFFSPWLKYPASSQKIFSTSYFVYSNKVLLNFSVRPDGFHPPIKHKKVISCSLKSCLNEHKKGLLQNSTTQLAITISKISEKVNNTKSKCITSPSKNSGFREKVLHLLFFM